GDEDVAPFADGAPGELARREQLGEAVAVAPGDLDVALHRDVPQRDVGEQAPVFRLELVIADRQQHVVVHGVAAAAGALRGGKIRRALETRSTLEQGGIEYHLWL